MSASNVQQTCPHAEWSPFTGVKGDQQVSAVFCKACENIVWKSEFNAEIRQALGIRPSLKPVVVPETSCFQRAH
ncbi:MAG: hypothetical protein K0U52_00685 [Gammaproteobacteria bacterium]|nr:hypothetical protein [Gammaproteobacteria bacterium]